MMENRELCNLNFQIIHKMNRVITALCASLLLCGCAKQQDGGSFGHSVCVTNPVAADGMERKTFSGVVEETDGISLGFKTPGQLKRILVKEGDYVSRGQLLAELDDADYLLGVEAAQIQYDQLRDEVERATRLFEKNSMSVNDYEKATAGLRQLGVQLQVNKNKLDYTKLYAPVAGYIQSVNFSPAEMVDAGTSVFSLLDVSGMEVVVDIPSSLYERASDFSGFSCRPSGRDNGQWIPLTFQSLVPKADSNQLYRMRLAVPAAEVKSLVSGMNMDVAVEVTDSQADIRPAVWLPVSALFRDAGGVECVWVLQPDSTVAKRQVEVDHGRSGNGIAVTSGVALSDNVVRAGVNVLTPGEKVRVIAEPSETNVGGLL